MIHACFRLNLSDFACSLVNIVFVFRLTGASEVLWMPVIGRTN